MGINQDEKALEYWSDKKLLEEATTPTGAMPLFLVHTQIEKRKNYRNSANARNQTSPNTIFEEDVAEFSGGGLGQISQNMSEMPLSSIPPPSTGMPSPQGMPPPPQGIMAMAGGGQLANDANELASQGRYGDSMLVHMNPIEVAAMNQNNELTINPTTGLPEAWAWIPPAIQAGRLGLQKFISKAPSWLGGRKPITDPTKLIGHTPGTQLASRQQIGPIKTGIDRGLTNISEYIKKNPWKTVTAGTFGGIGAYEYFQDDPLQPDAETDVAGAGAGAGTGFDITKYYPELMQSEDDYTTAREKAESYRSTPEERKNDAQAVAYSGLARALGNVNMEDIISGVADVTPQVLATRKMQTEDQRITDKTLEDLRKGRQSEKIGSMEIALKEEQIAQAREYYKDKIDVSIVEAAITAFQQQIGTSVTLEEFIAEFQKYYQNISNANTGGGAAQQLVNNFGTSRST